MRAGLASAATARWQHNAGLAEGGATTASNMAQRTAPANAAPRRTVPSSGEILSSWVTVRWEQHTSGAATALRVAATVLEGCKDVTVGFGRGRTAVNKPRASHRCLAGSAGEGFGENPKEVVADELWQATPRASLAVTTHRPTVAFSGRSRTPACSWRPCPSPRRYGPRPAGRPARGSAGCTHRGFGAVLSAVTTLPGQCSWSSSLTRV